VVTNRRNVPASRVIGAAVGTTAGIDRGWVRGSVVRFGGFGSVNI
jgi:hypothetical protein